MNLLDLPTDIVMIVLDELERKDLLQLVLVNKPLQVLAERVIWREIDWSWSLDTLDLTRRCQRVSHFIQAAAERPNLAASVQRLKLSFLNTFEEKCYLSSHARYVPTLRVKSWKSAEELWFCYCILNKYSCPPPLMQRWWRELYLGNFDAYCGLLILCCSHLREISLSHRFIEGNIFITAALELSATCHRRFTPRNRILPQSAGEFRGAFFGNIEGFTSSIDMPWNPKGHTVTHQFPGGLLNALWKLPQLSKLDFWVDFESLDPPRLPPTVKTLVLRAREGRYLISYSLKQLLSNTPALTSLTIFIASFKRVIPLYVTLRYLKPVQGTLRILKFQTDIRGKPDDRKTPVQSFDHGLAEFNSLHTLETFIPTLFSTRSQFGREARYLAATLPPNLRTLRLSAGLINCENRYWLTPLQRTHHKSHWFEERGITEPPRFMEPLSEYFGKGSKLTNLDIIVCERFDKSWSSWSDYEPYYRAVCREAGVSPKFECDRKGCCDRSI